MEISVAVRALGALAQTSRLRIFKALVEAGPAGLQPSDLAGALGVPANTLSFHLKTLMAARLVYPERRGRALQYRANFEEMAGLVGFLTLNCCGGQPCAVSAPCEPSSVLALENSAA